MTPHDSDPLHMVRWSPDTGVGTRPERLVEEPRYPILDASEVWDGVSDYRDQLTPEQKANLRSDEIVIDIHRVETEYPLRSLSATDSLFGAAGVSSTAELGNNSIMASINPTEGGDPSKYEYLFGRDSAKAGKDLRKLFPRLSNRVVDDLLKYQGRIDEPFIAGKPYGFEKLGAIILVKRDYDDPLAQKFMRRKLWTPVFYGSVDGPGLLIDLMVDLTEVYPGYLDSEYSDYHGVPHLKKEGFDLSVQWLLDRTQENTQGLIVYQNPYSDGKGMRNQGWKDSAGAMVHKDGQWANSQCGVAPIEVQCQAFDALRKAARVYRHELGDDKRAQECEEKALNIQRFVIENGWVSTPWGGHFVTGWDWDENGQIRRIETFGIDSASPMGGGLLKGDNPIMDEMVRETIRAFHRPEILTDYGFLTMASTEKAFGSRRYHEGSLWPNFSDETARNFSNHGYYALDRNAGHRTTKIHEETGVFPEHGSVENGRFVIPTQDVYVYSPLYNETYLVEQAPPLVQTWVVTGEMAKQHRYHHIPHHATDPRKLQLEKELLS